MKKKHKYIDTLTFNNVRRWIRLQTLAIMVATVISFFIVEFGINHYQFSWNLLYRTIGMTIPMLIFISFVNMATVSGITKQVTDLANALKAAADGDYHAKLDPEETNIFKEVCNNFNILEEELKKANTLQDEFVNNYSHEFKTPITSIKGFAELLLDEDVSEKDRKKYLKIIAEESDKLVSLANNSILMTKLNSQSIIPNKKEFSLDEQIRKCVILLEPGYTKKNIDVSCNLEEVNYYGSEELMEHLWINLVSNAIKYTNENGKILVNLREYKNTIIFSVIDNGIGMSKEELTQIFNKFYQVDKSKTNKGLGLGLTIVSRIIQMINGKIDVESEPGKGSKFTITIYKEDKK